jgi:apolipoprotein N-acyltransferase
LELLTIVGTVFAGFIILGLIVGFMYILPDWGKGLVIVLFAACVISSFVYGLTSSSSSPYPTEDPYEQYYQDLGTPGGS